MIIIASPVFPDGDELSYLQGKFNPAKQPGFTKLPSKISARDHLYLRNEVISAFEQMAAAAQEEGVSLYVLSATRNFAAQKQIWEAKFNGSRYVGGKDLTKSIPDHRKRALEILKYSSMPGTSRHHWGTDFDISFNKKNSAGMLENETYEKGEGKRVYEWMRLNAGRFGFCQPYRDAPAQRNQGKYTLGYFEEKWHWSYAPTARTLLDAYIKHQKKLLPSGFDGAKAAGELYMQYVGNIHSDCR